MEKARPTRILIQVTIVTERFGCLVHAVVPTSGVLVVEPNVAKMRWLDLDVDRAYRLPHTAALMHRKGPHWTHE